MKDFYFGCSLSLSVMLFVTIDSSLWNCRKNTEDIQ